MLNISVVLFGISSLTFYSSFKNKEEHIIGLETPSRLEANKGTIKIGNVLKRAKKKHKFYLSIHDLEKHMFICGATGTGKSNFLQSFLINFAKRYEIPFFLVEFKGEYHFLQKRIEDLLILWPGENFSINIFNPENSQKTLSISTKHLEKFHPAFPKTFRMALLAAVLLIPDGQLTVSQILKTLTLMLILPADWKSYITV